MGSLLPPHFRDKSWLSGWNQVENFWVLESKKNKIQGMDDFVFKVFMCIFSIYYLKKNIPRLHNLPQLFLFNLTHITKCVSARCRNSKWVNITSFRGKLEFFRGTNIMRINYENCFQCQKSEILIVLLVCSKFCIPNVTGFEFYLFFVVWRFRIFGGFKAIFI